MDNKPEKDRLFHTAILQVGGIIFILFGGLSALPFLQLFINSRAWKVAQTEEFTLPIVLMAGFVGMVFIILGAVSSFVGLYNMRAVILKNIVIVFGEILFCLLILFFPPVLIFGLVGIVVIVFISLVAMRLFMVRAVIVKNIVTIFGVILCCLSILFIISTIISNQFEENPPPISSVGSKATPESAYYYGTVPSVVNDITSPDNIQNQINDTSKWETYSNNLYSIRYPKFLTVYKDSENSSSFQDSYYFRKYPLAISYMGEVFNCQDNECINQLEGLAKSPSYRIENQTKLKINNNNAIKGNTENQPSLISILIRVGKKAFLVNYGLLGNEKDKLFDNMLTTLKFL